MWETDEQRGSPIPASPRNTPSPELAGLHPGPAINDYVQEPQHDVEIRYRMEVEDQYDGNDDDDKNNWEGVIYERKVMGMSARMMKKTLIGIPAPRRCCREGRW
ncbi:hypothetical protein BDR07DRAFT_149711 [Suillus spraguei]|nr:hypothetical protein BDR07DRAFT_149711 [Suillus spraguei]